ncbi:SAM-dependent methyltransferase [Agaricicola taiwanensis]|uniref:SAM-dependent methyltransferase n=1 Tax=Agaricicola taiwanensis TaxID=591372 RepID=A0A8J2YH20_9RHOB|nr:class I SAM-dependent methyltransferase [Agaricicola taiwanensis]GGE39738.1 SAM-dependent methyltransferase [Agaricicola taiwanensis]
MTDAALKDKAAVRRNLDDGAIRKAYKRWAPVYDLVFGAVFDKGRQKALEIINSRTGTLLEVGVGTGIALPAYGQQVTVTGIDLSHDMLMKAQERVTGQRLSNVTGVAVMDATQTGFADASFDMAVAMYLITVVPDPEGVLQEMARLVKPGGDVILVNHFVAEEGVRAKIEKGIAPFSHSLGWHPDFPMERVLGCPDLELIDRVPIGALGIYTLLHFRRKAAAPPVPNDGAGASFA